MLDLFQPLLEVGYSEAELWALTYSQLKRRLAARRRLLAIRRNELLDDVRMAVNGEADDVKAHLQRLHDENP